MKRTLSAAWSWKRLHDLPEGHPSVWSSSSSGGGGGGGVSGDASKSSQGIAGGEPRLCESFSMFTHQFRSSSSANFNCAFRCRAGRVTPAPLPSCPLLCISHCCICHRSLTALYFPFQSISSHTHPTSTLFLISSLSSPVSDLESFTLRVRLHRFSSVKPTSEAWQPTVHSHLCRPWSPWELPAEPLMLDYTENTLQPPPRKKKKQAT